jgi:hypothetical protein
MKIELYCRKHMSDNQEQEQVTSGAHMESSIRRSTRKTKAPKKFQDEVYLPGSNNKWTKGRPIDQYER